MGKDRNNEQTSQEETLEEVFAQLDDLAEKLEDKGYYYCTRTVRNRKNS